MPAGKLVNIRNKINKTYGFFVGINEYQSRELNLNGCVRDAQDLQQAFSTNEYELILNQDATRKNILGKVNRFMNLKKGDLLIITFSCHGAIINRDLAILPCDMERDNLLGTGLSTLYLLNALSAISENGAKVLIILDLCHSGALNFDLSKYSGALSGGGISSIYACGPNENAMEMTFDGVTRGIFTKFLIEGLNGAADDDGLEIVTLRPLYDFVYQNVCKSVPNQHPALIGTLPGNTIIRQL